LQKEDKAGVQVGLEPLLKIFERIEAEENV